jgi:putative oxidoreductase
VALEAHFQRIPHTVIAFIARFSLAAVFWQSGQSKIEGLAIHIVNGEWLLAGHGWPRTRFPCLPRNTACRC